jgi:hypothetical protein
MAGARHDLERRARSAPLYPDAVDEFKNAYKVAFLGLAADHSEADLHGALLRNLGRFLTELGRDFCFVGSQYPVQVGNQDFAIDLVFFHRGLQCLVAFELKVDKFRLFSARFGFIVPVAIGIVDLATTPHRDSVEKPVAKTGIDTIAPIVVPDPRGKPHGALLSVGGSF